MEIERKDTNIYHVNGSEEKARRAILLLHKTCFKTKIVTRDEDTT